MITFQRFRKATFIAAMCIFAQMPELQYVDIKKAGQQFKFSD